MDYKNMIDNLAYLGMFWRSLFSSFDGSYSNLPINKTQEKVLIFIKNHPEKTMGEISKITGLEKGSFTPLVDNLINLRLIERKRSEKDRRVIYLYLTEEGSKLADRIIQALNTHLDQKFSIFTSTEKAEFLMALDMTVSIFSKVDTKEKLSKSTI